MGIKVEVGMSKRGSVEVESHNVNIDEHCDRC